MVLSVFMLRMKNELTSLFATLMNDIEDASPNTKSKLQEIYPSISTAVIVEGAKQRMIANIFYALVKLNSPIKSFKTLEQCLIWSNEVLNSGSVNKNKVLL